MAMSDKGKRAYGEAVARIEEAANDGRKFLDLSRMGLTKVPGEIGQLASLEVLWLDDNKLTALPGEIGQLTGLMELGLQDNQLTALPGEIWQLTRLTALDLRNNQLTALPGEIGQLTGLMELGLQDNKLTALPGEIGQLTRLTKLNLGFNQLTELPGEIWQLTRLTAIDLRNNQLTALPGEIGQLTSLTKLYLENNQLTALPGEIGQLTRLTMLRLDWNQLRALPGEIGQLTRLEMLWLNGNQLTALPGELGRLEKLEILALHSNPLESPGPEVVEQGTEAVLAYLRGVEKGSERQWVSKLIVVGEGGVGKTSLLRALKEEEFILGFETTHGIDVDKIELCHPSIGDVTMRLNTWDFGGQTIYHATHQFFLTTRSLYVLVWDARHGWEAGKLYYWLDTIQARAPEAPVLIVAAHIDERAADLPREDLKKKYPQIVDYYEVSNKTGDGIGGLRGEIAKVAADEEKLPLMGEKWPASWLDAANEIRARKERYIEPRELGKVMKRHKVKGKDEEVLTGWLHELGDILYFADDEELNDLVILDPQWVTEAISEVLESKEVIEKDGILTSGHLDQLWKDIGDENIRKHLLRLMEKFDLSYRTLENKEISLVVERLPLDPPDYEGRWDAIKDGEGCKEISMKFELSSMQAGLPTWFIARSHRFTTHTHWRMGALFADDHHLALVKAVEYDRYLQLSARGAAPHNFFAILRDGLELTLARFPGLNIKRTMPCPGCMEKNKKVSPEKRKAVHEFEYEHLLRRYGLPEPKLKIECPECYADVSVLELLFGLAEATQDAVLKRMDTLIGRIDEHDDEMVRNQGVIITELAELRELVQREFLRRFVSDQELAESHCPNVFAMVPKEGRRWLGDIFGHKMCLQLYCQAPGHWHPTYKGGCYEIKKAAEWLGRIGPYVVGLAKVLKFAAPLVGPVAGMVDVVFAEGYKHQFELMKELAGKLSGGSDIAGEMVEGMGQREKMERVEGAELRAVRVLLDEVDARHEWGGLKKVLTPEGHYLWLCGEHAKEYKS